MHVRVKLGRYFDWRRGSRLKSRVLPARWINGVLRPQAGPCLPPLEDGKRAANFSALRAQMVALSGEQRSNSEFVPWKTDIFYYLYAAVASVLAPWLIEVAPVGWSLTGIVTTGLCFGLLCYAPMAANDLRFWVGFSLPNRRLRRRIALLQAEMERLKGQGVRY